MHAKFALCLAAVGFATGAWAQSAPPAPPATVAAPPPGVVQLQAVTVSGEQPLALSTVKAACSCAMAVPALHSSTSNAIHFFMPVNNSLICVGYTVNSGWWQQSSL